jgi:hypothetical protein
MRTAAYSFTLLCIAYGIAEASFWSIFPIALFFGILGAGKFSTVMTAVVWLLLVIGLAGKIMRYLGCGLYQALKEGAPTDFHSWRYALAIMAIAIVVLAVLPSWLGLQVNGFSWFGSPALSFFGRLTSVLLAIAALPSKRRMG